MLPPPRRLCNARRLQCLSVCPSVCLLATLLKSTEPIFMKILSLMCLLTTKNWLNSGRHPSLDPDPQIFSFVLLQIQFSFQHLFFKLIHFTEAVFQWKSLPTLISNFHKLCLFNVHVKQAKTEASCSSECTQQHLAGLFFARWLTLFTSTETSSNRPQS